MKTLGTAQRTIIAGIATSESIIKKLDSPSSQSLSASYHSRLAQIIF